MALSNLLEGAGREGGVVGLAAVPAHAGGGRAVRAVRGRDTHGAAQQRRGDKQQQQQQGRGGGHGDDGLNTTGSSLLALHQLNEEREDRKSGVKVENIF